MHANRWIKQACAMALITSATTTITPSALAQSITLSGVADIGARLTKSEGSASVQSLISGSNSTSRLVIRGSEDLGGGLGAGFWLEHGLLLDTGASASSAQFWDRRSTASLSDKALGELRAGRDFVPSYANWSRYDPFTYVGVAGSNNLISAAPAGPIRSAFSTSPNTTVRSSNALQWLLPSGWAGLEGSGMLAAGEGGTAANGQHKVMGARLGWSNRQFGVSAASTRSENNLTRVAGSQFEDRAIGANADLGKFRVSLAHRVFKHGTAKQQNSLLGLWVPVGQVELKASFARADFSGRVGAVSIDANGAQQLGLGWVYSLSRRSALYGTVSRIENKGVASFVVPGGSAVRAGGSSSGIDLGIRHNF